MRKDGRKKQCVCEFCGFRKAYNWVNRESLWKVLRMYDMGCKLLNVIKGMFSIACIRVKGGGVRVSVSGSIVV